MMLSDESKCVNCQRCVSLCPTRALKIVKSDCTLRENANWSNDTIREIYKQASSAGVLLSSMGNPKPLPVYWDKLLLNASQVAMGALAGIFWFMEPSNGFITAGIVLTIVAILTAK